MPKQRFHNSVSKAPYHEPGNRAYDWRDADHNSDTGDRLARVHKGKRKADMNGARQREADQQIRELGSRC